MKRMLHLAAFAVACLTPPAVVAATAVPQGGEVTFIKDARRLPDAQWQARLRQQPAWKQFLQAHPAWVVEFNEATGTPHRAFGPAIPVPGSTPLERATTFLGQILPGYGLSMQEVELQTVASATKFNYVHFTQRHDGHPVLFAHGLVKLDLQGRVVSFGLDLYGGLGAVAQQVVADPELLVAAQAGLEGILSAEVLAPVSILPVPDARSITAHSVREVVVHTRSAGMPGRWRALVDIRTGELLYRVNDVKNEHFHGEAEEAGADVTVSSAIVNTPLAAPVDVVMRNLGVTIGGTDFTTDLNGTVNSGISGPVGFNAQLSGLWSTVLTNGTTPALSGTLVEGANAVDFNAVATLQERSAYYHVNSVHDHCKSMLPDFDGMDFSLPTNVDLTSGNCNAFYDGSSINFYAEGNDCHALAKMADVVYHEYGHGINDNFYQSLGSSFNNGGMNEGYADFWGYSITLNPVLAEGWTISNQASYIRRYDNQRKVYPADLVGQVHADGEIIAGAWWDTYQLLGNNMPLTMQLFAEAFPGLQAVVANGNEGVAFRDVLLDALQADDDDGNLVNGTPNGSAIGEAFRLHGITLLTGFDVQHAPLAFAPVQEGITINAQATITGVFQEYFQGVELNYRVNQGAWQTQMMTNTGGSNYEAVIPAQPAGTVVSYYVGLLDVGNVLSGVTPSGADQADPNLPNFILVGYELKLTENVDDLNQLGDWELGVAGDNNTTGTWEVGDPEPSLSTVDGSEIQPDNQFTAGGEGCFFTGNASDPNSPGANDVDAGRTTLLSDPIDLTPYENPTFTLRRWYTNSPPGGANPAADWWYVQVSADGNNWVFVENTRTDDRAWRRLAFRVQDYLGDVPSMRIRFIASDSTRLGQNLDGGSLVEALVDEIELWDNLVVGIEEQAGHILSLYPDPATEVVNAVIDVPAKGRVIGEVLDPAGRVVLAYPLSVTNGTIRAALDVRALSPGGYVLRARWEGGAVQRRFNVMR
jgi:hypothetical protein